MYPQTHGFDLQYGHIPGSDMKPRPSKGLSFFTTFFAPDLAALPPDFARLTGAVATVFTPLATVLTPPVTVEAPPLTREVPAEATFFPPEKRAAGAERTAD